MFFSWLAIGKHAHLATLQQEGIVQDERKKMECNEHRKQFHINIFLSVKP
jgi:predicted transcriptional regulator